MTATFNNPETPNVRKAALVEDNSMQDEPIYLHNLASKTSEERPPENTLVHKLFHDMPPVLESHHCLSVLQYSEQFLILLRR